MKCNQCEALMINGVFCHETDCPNTRSRYDAESGEWIKQRKCFECGCMVDMDDLCCNAPDDYDDTEELGDRYSTYIYDDPDDLLWDEVEGFRP